MIDLALLVFINLCWGTIVVELAISPAGPLMFLWGMVACSLCVWMIWKLYARLLLQDGMGYIRTLLQRRR